MKRMSGFDEFITKNIVKKQTRDRSRAEFLFKESERSYSNLLERIAKIPLTDANANDYVKSCYDIVMELIRAKMLLDGFNAAGQGAHEAEISYMGVLGFNERDVRFADQMRFFRNGMMYYGTMIDSVYAEKVWGFTQKIYAQLTKLLEGELP